MPSRLSKRTIGAALVSGGNPPSRSALRLAGSWERTAHRSEAADLCPRCQVRRTVLLEDLRYLVIADLQLRKPPRIYDDEAVLFRQGDKADSSGATGATDKGTRLSAGRSAPRLRTVHRGGREEFRETVPASARVPSRGAMRYRETGGTRWL